MKYITFIYFFIIFLLWILFYGFHKSLPEHYHNHGSYRTSNNHPTIDRNDINLNNQRQSTDYYEFTDYSAPYPFSYYDNLNNNIFSFSYHPNNYIFNGEYKTSKKCVKPEPIIKLESEINNETKINTIGECKKTLSNNSAGAYKTFI